MRFEEMLVKPECKKYETVTFKIDGQSIIGNIVSREEFIRTFNELETLIWSDDRKYWVLYEEHSIETPAYLEVFWCIPASEINFKYDDVLGWRIVSGVTLDEECSASPVGVVKEFNEYEEYEQALMLFDKFECSFSRYLLFDNRANEVTFKLWKALTCDVNNSTDADIIADNKACLIIWLKNNWNAWLNCVLDGSFKYMNVSSIVLESWKEFCN